MPAPLADVTAEVGQVYGPVRLLVVQPTPYCNLDCDYCYLPERGDRSRLSFEVLEVALERVLDSPYFGGEFTLLWHAGEPLMVPIAFYDEATERIHRLLERRGLPPGTIVQSLQTNATVINAAWCDCFTRNGIHVGVSMDGPAFLHDAHRVTRTGLPTHAAVMRGIDWLVRRGVPFQVICVLTADALDHADAIADFFLQHGITEVGFNMEETEGANSRSSLDAGGAGQMALEQRYRAFMARLWQRSRELSGRLRIREFDGIASLACSQARMVQTDMNTPFVIVNVDARGQVSTFDPELLSVNTPHYGDFSFGNVLVDSLEALAGSDKFRRVAAEIRAGVELCRASCEHFGLCGGGTGSNKYWEHGRFDCTQTQHCRYRIQLVADVVLEGLEHELGLSA
ncbi:GRRM system radical SAM/SPASM domain protein [Synechococcus sp. HJ21-Hayes]|uniref:cyclophane-forming radical SAM/SPASM peptide maturase GrrM/OscB n=1 Tax=unclassified Synechococcus TaxID=2626047 RepID=UPI0020CD5084|nr:MULTISPECIES: cyclophane-forming radical SAM/SPASM peptide maturase GrrM/OscB [unclassified Synechococcus]MCP9830493.1 GRRM system radical SAM/SPASM domain protein [Synechococcus sp. JJ3a-Johnson]MCP9852316.1 GRRM system radical SAM/SPASM domain protein [Synechococcus sp. HJ21-Hayes]